MAERPYARECSGAAQALRDALHLMWRVADRYTRTRLLVALTLVSVGAGVAALTPLALKLSVDRLSEGTNRYSDWSPMALIALYVAGQYLCRLFTEFRVLAFSRGEQRFRRRIGMHLFEHIVHLPMRAHLERSAGAIGEIASQSLIGYQLILSHAIYTILPVTIEFIVIAAVLVGTSNYEFVGILSTATVLYVMAFRHGANAIHGPALAGATTNIHAHSILNDTLQNYEAVKCFCAETVVGGRYKRALAQIENYVNVFFNRRVANGIVVGTIFAITLGVSLFYAAHCVSAGTMSLGEFVIVNAYVLRIVQPLEMLGFALRDVAQGIAFLRNTLSLLAERRESADENVGVSRDSRSDASDERDSLVATACEDSGGAKYSQSAPLSRPGQLVFQNVTFSYDDGKVALNCVSFLIQPGRTLAVVGASGSGKSSIVRLLFRLYEPNRGQILLDGIPISKMPHSSVRQAFAVVPQNPVLFNDTIARNIGIGLQGSSQWEIEAAARMASMHEFILGLPEGYETMVGERGLKLSGGERQRLAIARAYMRKPRLFVFDEPTSSLDSSTELDILRNLVDCGRRTTTLVIAHRLSTIMHADEILVLHEGSIVERGTHASLIELEGRYTALWRARQRRMDSGEPSEASVA